MTRLQSPDPSSARVAKSLREQIQSGRFRSGEYLPAERELVKELGVYRGAVREAIVTLEREGLLHREPRHRPRVVDNATTQVKHRGHTQVDASNLVALIMWHGDMSEQGKNAQQQIHWGMTQALAKAGYHGMYLDLGEEIGSEQENAEREAAHLRYVLANRFGGVVFYSYAYRQNTELVREVAAQMPLVLLDRMTPGIDTDLVAVDNYEATYRATMHLIELGHRRTMYVTPIEPINPIQERLCGYLAAIHSAFGGPGSGVVVGASTVDVGGAWPIFDSAFRLSETERPTCVICANDYEAVRVAERLGQLGLTIPGDVSVVGFDNKIITLSHGVGLTTIAQPYEEIGRAAAQVFLDRVTSPERPCVYKKLTAELIVRESSAAPSRTSHSVALPIV